MKLTTENLGGKGKLVNKKRDDGSQSNQIESINLQKEGKIGSKLGDWKLQVMKDTSILPQVSHQIKRSTIPLPSSILPLIPLNKHTIIFVIKKLQLLVIKNKKISWEIGLRIGWVTDGWTPHPLMNPYEFDQTKLNFTRF